MLHVVTILLAVGGVIPVCKSLGPLIGRECCTPETTPDRTQDLALKVDEG